jgi:hypothetical protein
MYTPQIFAGIVPPVMPGISTRELAWPSQTAVARCGV